MITRDEAKKHFQECLKKHGAEGISIAFSEHLRYLLENESKLDEEAKKYADEQFKLLDQLNDRLYEQVKQAPDSIQARNFKRAYVKMKGAHFQVLELLKKLDAAPNLKIEIIKEARDVFCVILQPALNYLCDVHQEQLKFDETAILALCFACIDELLVAMHLAEHNYAAQAFNHARVAMEILEKVSLFLHNPDELEAWWQNQPKKIRNKFRYKSVRKRQGKPDESIVYHLLSNLGIHGDLDYLKTKLKMVYDGDKTMHVTLNLGGSKQDEDLLVAALGMCIASAGDLYAKIIKAFEGRLLADEIKQDFEAMIKATEGFLEKYFYPACERLGMNVSEMRKVLNRDEDDSAKKD